MICTTTLDRTENKININEDSTIRVYEQEMCLKIEGQPDEK